MTSFQDITRVDIKMKRETGNYPAYDTESHHKQTPRQCDYKRELKGVNITQRGCDIWYGEANDLWDRQRKVRNVRDNNHLWVRNSRWSPQIWSERTVVFVVTGKLSSINSVNILYTLHVSAPPTDQQLYKYIIRIPCVRATNWLTTPRVYYAHSMCPRHLLISNSTSISYTLHVSGPPTD